MNRTHGISPKTKQMVGDCCICSGEHGLAENPLVKCYGQGCSVVVHKACYGIVDNHDGSWLCRKCEFEGDDDKTCELCPSKDGALKRTEHRGWAHVVCCLYIPEIKFENDSTLEPIILKRVPLERYNKSCSNCESKGQGSKAKFGACINCFQSGCQNHFHVTCGQAAGGLLREKKENSSVDAYCGYCPYHNSQSKSEREAIKPLLAVTKPSDLAPEISSSALADSSEQVSGVASSHGSKKKKRKKPGRRSSRRVGICRDWTYSSAPVVVDSVKMNDGGGGATKSLKSEMDPFTNVLTAVGFVPKEVVSKSDVGSANSTEELTQKEDENAEALKSSGSRTSVAPIDDPSKSAATLEECIASFKEPFTSETPTSLCGYDSESTLPNTSDFGSNIKYNLDYLFSQMSTGNLANELVSSGSKASKASDAPSSSSDSAHGKQHSFKRKKKRTTSSLLVSPPIILECQLIATEPESSIPTSFNLQERSHPETSSPEQFHCMDISCSSSAAKESANQQKCLVNEPQLPDSQLNPAAGTEQEMSGELDTHTSSAFALPSSAAPDPHPMAEQFQRIWEEGNQFLMEEGQFHEVASLLASLHILRQSNTQLEGHVNSLIQRRNDLLDVNAKVSIPLISQLVTRAPLTTNTGSLNGDSVHVFLRELGKICNPLSPSSPEMGVSASTSTKEQQLPQLHRPNIHSMSSAAVPRQHGLNAGREVSDGR